MLKKVFFKEIDDISEYDDTALDGLKIRITGAVLVIILFAAVILFRLWFLQIHKGGDFRDLAYNNRVRVQLKAAPRGIILDRNGVEIVTNRPSFNVMLMREDSIDIENVLKKLAEVLDQDISELWQRIRVARKTPKHIPIMIKNDIDWNTLAYLENHNQELSGVRVEVVPARIYHFENLMAHAIGYLGEISKKELSKADPDLYQGGDLIGKMGLERLRQSDLMGEKGSSLSEVNARGFEQQSLNNVKPLPGNEIRLTLDVNLQRVAEAAMSADDKSGAVVAMEVRTGRLLVLASNPQLHLNQFVGGISHKNWQALLDNPKHPLINKVVQGTYPPGSTYKMVTALAGLAKGVIDKDTVFYCPGFYKFGNRRYNCWKHSGHGAVDLKRALSESCDVYFYQVGLKVGVDVLAEFARKLGLGKKSGVEIEHEKSGLIPTKSWKQNRYGQKWQEGETLSIAIGQGFNLTTPLQVCLMTAVVANGGTVYRPQLVERVTDPDGKIIERFIPEVLSQLNGVDGYLRLIREGMVEVIHGKRGTARKTRIEGLTIGGKTGTAQVVRVSQYKHLKEEDIPYKYRDHAWFTCYAPAENPEIAVTVLVEHGLHGGSVAAPVARKILQKYFAARLISSIAEKNSQGQEKGDD